MFRVGQKVVCVKEAPIGPCPHFFKPVRLNAIYTVRGLVDDRTGRALVYLEEIRNVPQLFEEGLHEPPYPPDRFRPVVERKTSIEVFKKLLNPTPQKVLEVQALESHSECAGSRS